jgi:hypothetical protein
MAPSRKGNPSFRFCALAYGRVGEEGLLSLERVVFILVGCLDGPSYISVRPNWRGIVDPNDKDFIEELLGDFGDRIGREPESLLKQASHLSVGPLITYLAGNRLDDYPELLALNMIFAGKDLPCS